MYMCMSYSSFNIVHYNFVCVLANLYFMHAYYMCATVVLGAIMRLFILQLCVRVLLKCPRNFVFQLCVCMYDFCVA